MSSWSAIALPCATAVMCVDQAWIMADVLYIASTALIARSPSARSILGFARPVREFEEQTLAGTMPGHCCLRFWLCLI